MRNGPIEGFRPGDTYDQTTERAYNDARYMPKDLDATTVTDPALNAAVSTAVIDAYGGVIITLTGAGNAQTLQSPTATSVIKRFIVVANDTNGANTIAVNGIILSAGEAQWFIWDGTAWIAVTAVDAGNIAFTPAGNLVAVNVQAAIEELDTEKVDTGDSRLSDDRDPNNHASDHTDGNDDIQSATNAQKGLATAAHIQAIEANSGKTGVTTQISNVSQDTTPTLGGRLEINEKDLLIDIALADDHSWTGPVQIITAGENLAIFETAYLKSDGKYWKIDGSAEATAKGKIVMATAAINADDPGIGLLPSPLSFIRDDSTDKWTTTNVGEEMYLSLTSGELTNNVSGHTTTGDIVRVAGYMETAAILNFDAAKTWVEVA